MLITANTVDGALQQVKQDKEEKIQALTTALPGPAKQAFAVIEDIKVGDKSFRMFRDVDFRFLAAINHPLVALRLSEVTKIIDEKKVDERFDNVINALLPNDEMAWCLYWILTRPTREVRDVLKSAGGINAMKEKAEEEFGEYQLLELKAFMEAALQAFTIYWSTPVGIKAKGAEEVHGGSNPPLPAV